MHSYLRLLISSSLSSTKQWLAFKLISFNINHQYHSKSVGTITKSKMSQLTRILVLALFIVGAYGDAAVNKKKDTFTSTPVVTYDSRSMIINGSRELLFSGSIHYPRSTPDMWPDLIKKAKQGGLNVIQTYVFWNIHEPIQGQFNFEGNYDLIKFIKLLGDSGMWVTLRIGPYIEAEWNFGGFPYWLKEVPGVLFRTYNEPYIYHMKRYCENIVNMVKAEKLFADQGGPIILAQIENEYNNVQFSYKEMGIKYVHWAGELAGKLYSGIPWVMCKQKDAPSTIISTCNGRSCADTFEGPNGPDKPTLWTENWTAQYRVFGDGPSQRSAEDLAFAVARFFAKNGTLNNYYMYHGGTNFGRTSSSFVTTRYYDEAPLDEFGLMRDPKYGHLRDLHKALRLCKKPLLWGTNTYTKINKDLEISVYEKPGTNICAAFLMNNNTRNASKINLRGVDYHVLPKSVSILPDCKTVVFNTKTVVAQHSSRNFVKAPEAQVAKWEMYKEAIPTIDDLPEKTKRPREIYHITKDTSDYVWFSTRIELDDEDLPMRPDIIPVLQIKSLGHALLGFVNGKYVGFGHGTNVEKQHVFTKPVPLKAGFNDITLLGMTVGIANSGALMEKRYAGPHLITLQGLMSGTLDISLNGWGNQPGVSGERIGIFTEEGSKKVNWVPYVANNHSVTWYKGYFDAPYGNDPVAIRMMGMEKGMVWINGKNIGRYWVSYLSPLGKPTQEEYHIPRVYLKPKGNLIVVFEETGGYPELIEIQTVNRNTICSIVNDFHTPPVNSFERKKNEFRATSNPPSAAYLNCPNDLVIQTVEHASYGLVGKGCGSLVHGNCSSSKPHKVVEQLCLGKPSCTIPFDKSTLYDGNELCPGVAKKLGVQVKCGPIKKSDA